MVFIVHQKLHRYESKNVYNDDYKNSESSHKNKKKIDLFDQNSLFGSLENTAGRPKGVEFEFSKDV